MIVVDTSGLLAVVDEAQGSHKQAASIVEGADEPLLISPIVVAELDYMIARWVGNYQRVAFLRQVKDGYYSLQSFDSADMENALGLIEKYEDLKISLADASCVLFAHRFKTNRILTFDQRHFRVLKGYKGQPFEILPFDAG